MMPAARPTRKRPIPWRRIVLGDDYTFLFVVPICLILLVPMIREFWPELNQRYSWLREIWLLPVLILVLLLILPVALRAWMWSRTSSATSVDDADADSDETT